jgi:dihydroneopterin aldolase/D-erythro-7,8-dihydroneopterin triphosphate epimerase
MTEPGLDKIHIRDLLLRCIIGTHDDERRRKQDVVIGITLFADLGKAGETDSLDDTVDYSAIKRRVAEMVEQSSFFLVERLAQRVADVCLEDVRVRQVRVTVAKPGALRFARTVDVDIFRSRTQSGGAGP